jgi:hypothetical protein
MVAVPVSWQKGRMPRAAISAFLSIISATMRSFSEASGSSRMAATCARWRAEREVDRLDRLGGEQGEALGRDFQVEERLVGHGLRPAR